MVAPSKLKFQQSENDIFSEDVFFKVFSLIVIYGKMCIWAHC